MQFVPDGPDLPEEVVNAHEDGKLVLFCGAGISMPSGLPSFPRLVELVRDRLGADFERTEADAFRDGYLDRVLGLLERRFPASEVRRLVASILATPSEPELSLHRAIVSLSRERRSGFLRLVTTNFDRLFFAADETLPSHVAPALPVPKPPIWNSVVYLHGHLDPSDPDCRRLVLTSGDFGLAYLLEGWASLFVRELFRHFDVLFVGYSVSDPVLRYLVDALAAERQRGIPARLAYALAPMDGPLEDIRNSWLAKNIVPILYDPAQNYRRLRDTLVAWDSLYSTGLASKQSVVSEAATLQPRSIPPDHLSRILWALREESGIVAAHFASREPPAQLDWLSTFEREGLLGDDAAGSRRPLLVARRESHFRYLGPLPLPVQALAHWLVEHHLDKPEFLRWVVHNGGHLHPVVAEHIQFQLRNRRTPRSRSLTRAWLALAGGVPLANTDGVPEHHSFDYAGILRHAPWSPELRLALLQHLSPSVRVRGPLILPDDEGSSESDLSPSMRSLLDCDVELFAGAATAELVEALNGRADQQSILLDVAFEISGLLRKTLDIMSFLESASEDWDRSYIDRPAVRDHQQNHAVHAWTALIELARDAFEAAVSVDRQLAESLAETWARTPYPVFRRLYLHAAMALAR